MSKERILITGANGFIGQSLVKLLRKKNIEVCSVVRSNPTPSDIAVGNISSATDWAEVLKHVDVVIHTAARAHVFNDSAADPLSEFRAVNVAATQKLIQDAHEAGVKRFVFLSSIGVLGNKTHGTAFNEASEVTPVDMYAISKKEAEQVVVELCTRLNMEYVIVRPVLVYGAAAPGNFGLLLKLAASGLPLPFNLLKQKRNLLALDSLVDLLVLCAQAPNAANQVFVVADDEQLSLSDIIANLRFGMSRTKRLFAFPGSLLRLGCALIGRGATFDKLNCELLVDNAKAKRTLNWQPRSAQEELRKAGADYVV